MFFGAQIVPELDYARKVILHPRTGNTCETSDGGVA
jgi:hypothetical protein